MVTFELFFSSYLKSSLTNLVRDEKFFTICLKNEVSEAILNTNKRII